MSIPKVERFFIEKANNPFKVLYGYSAKEIAKDTGLSYNRAWKNLKQMVELGILKKLPASRCYKLERDYFNNNYKGSVSVNSTCEVSLT